MSEPTPLLDFFKRGEVARDVRLLAAQGALAPRAHEQLAILVLLLDDPDPEIRATADETLNRIPEEALKAFLARSDVSVDLREFFADRGVFPAEIPAIEVDEPLIDTEADDAELPEADEREGVAAQLAKMSFPERLKAAVKGSREMRAILIRDPNKMIAAAVLSSPKLTEPEVEGFARMANVSEDVLRIIGNNRAWMKNYGVVVGLTKNPKTPLAMSMNLLSRLNDRDLGMLSVDRNVPSRCGSPRERGSRPAPREGLAVRLARRSSLRLCSPLLALPRPVRSHLRQPFHVDRRALALLLAGHRLQQVERPLEILVDRLLASSRSRAAGSRPACRRASAA